jgi:hypothetical protein
MLPSVLLCPVYSSAQQFVGKFGSRTSSFLCVCVCVCVCVDDNAHVNSVAKYTAALCLIYSHMYHFMLPKSGP